MFGKCALLQTHNTQLQCILEGSEGVILFNHLSHILIYHINII